MPVMTATLPDHLVLKDGDEADLHGVVVEGSFVVTQVLLRGNEFQPQRKKLGDWGRKWAGSALRSDDLSRDDLRMDYYREKFGL